MAFKRGDPKPAGSGIKKGQQQKRTLLKVEDFLCEQGIHPVERILALLPALEPMEAVRTWMELLKYCAPTFKPIESIPLPIPDNDIKTLEATSTEDLLALEEQQSNEPTNQTRALEKG